MGVDAHALDRLPPDARARLEAFTAALERVDVDDLVQYAARNEEPGHRQATEAAAVASREAGLEDVVEAAQRALFDAIAREFAHASFRVSWMGTTGAPTGGRTDERLRMMRSMRDAVSGIVLWDRLDAHDRDELLGLWSRLLP